MAYLIEHKAQSLYITASTVLSNGRRRKIIIESRPEYAVIALQGSKEVFPISWENLFETARKHHENNLRAEAKAEADAVQKAKGKRRR